MHGWTPISDAKSFAMPDISSLARESGQSLVLLSFRNWLTGHGVPMVIGSHAHAHYRNFVRLVDKAVRRYESARQYLEASVHRAPDETALDHVVRALSDLEDMFHAVHRALRLLDSLKGACEAPVTSVDLRPFPSSTVRRIRDANEHIDDYLAKGKIGAGDDVMLRVWAQGISFAGQSISYVTIQLWLTRLHGIARRLIEHDSLAAERRINSAA